MPAVAKPQLTIEWTPDPIVFGDAIMAVDGALNQTRIPLEAAAREIGIDIRERFETETDPSGKPWKPWSPTYEEIALSFPNEGILRRFGFLYEDATSADAMIIAGDSLFFDETQIPEYGVWHQEGRPDRKTKGGKPNPLPARRFLGMTAQTRVFIFATFEEWFNNALELYTTTLGKLGRRHAMHGTHPVTGKQGFIPRSTALPMRPR